MCWKCTCVKCPCVENAHVCWKCPYVLKMPICAGNAHMCWKCPYVLKMPINFGNVHRFYEFFLCGKLTNINNKNPKILTKRPPVAITVPAGTQRHHCAIGIPGYTFGSSIQARAIPPPSWGSAPPVTTGSL